MIFCEDYEYGIVRSSDSIEENTPSKRVINSSEVRKLNEFRKKLGENENKN